MRLGISLLLACAATAVPAHTSAHLHSHGPEGWVIAAGISAAVAVGVLFARTQSKRRSTL